MNYLLDTNVVSEGYRRRPDPNVGRWLRAVPAASLHLSVLVIGELRAGVERLRRKDPKQALALHEWLSGITVAYQDRILVIDARTGEEWGRMSGVIGPLPPIDGLFAATARVHDLTVVTRNVTHFERTGVRVLNPWEA